jgi:hypothetical protein
MCTLFTSYVNGTVSDSRSTYSDAWHQCQVPCAILHIDPGLFVNYIVFFEQVSSSSLREVSISFPHNLFF